MNVEARRKGILVTAEFPADDSPITREGLQRLFDTVPVLPKHAASAPARTAGNIGAASTDEAHAWYVSGINAMLADLQAAQSWPEGFRDEKGRGWEKLSADMALKLQRYALALEIDPADLLERFLDAAPRGGDVTVRWLGRKWHSQSRKAREMGAWPVPPNVGVSIFEPREDSPSAAEPITDDDLFWDARPELAHIRDFARSRRVSPLAMLGVALCRIATAVPPQVTLPPLTGGRASLNLYVALVGRSGEGKGVAVAAATDMFTGLPEPDVEHPGSGEGLVKLYARYERGGNGVRGGVHQFRSSVLAIVDEVDVLTSLGNRQGSTLIGTLRTAWNGQRLGFGYSDRDKAVSVGTHAYRLALILQAQPERCGALFNDADGGTPQRFIWLPVWDEAASDEPPAPVRPMALNLPDWGLPRHDMSVPAAAVEEIDRRRLAKLRREPGADQLDGHADLLRLKIAALLAVLDGREHINIYDWELSGHVMAISNRTRDDIKASLSQVASIEAERRGRAAGRVEVAKSAVMESAQRERISRRVLRYLSDGPLISRELSRRFAGSERAIFEEVLDALHSAGQVRVRDGAKGGKEVYLP